MFLQLGQTYTPSIEIKDSLGFPVTMDSPVSTIKNVSDNSYWNGFDWQKSLFNIMMIHVSDGVYTTSFTPNSVGIYQIVCKSDTYGKTSSIILEVAENNNNTYNWPVNTVFPIKITGDKDDTSNKLKIVRNSDNMFWNGDVWTQNESSIQMSRIGSTNTFIYNFTPDIKGSYSITSESISNQVFFILNVVDSDGETIPVIVNNNTLTTSDGDNTTVIDINGMPVPGVKVSAFNTSTKQLVSSTASDEQGCWNLVLNPGIYFFTFEKNGYISTGFEKAVI